MHPTWYHFPVAWSYWISGEYDTALAEAKKIDQPGYFWTHLLLATVYGALDRTQEGGAEVTKLLELYPDFPRPEGVPQVELSGFRDRPHHP
jgi:hypothetical protein